MEKIRFIQSMLAAGLSPLFSDLDVIWLRDPLPYVRRFEQPNILVSSDAWETAAGSSPGQLDDCHRIVGTERTVTAHSGYVGRMNVRHEMRASQEDQRHDLTMYLSWLHSEPEWNAQRFECCVGRSALPAAFGYSLYPGMPFGITKSGSVVDTSAVNPSAGVPSQELYAALHAPSVRL